jgi:glycosyltransferase involved in cell wall biosynthesis
LHVRSLIEATRRRIRHVLATVRGDSWRIEEHRSDGSSGLGEFARREHEPYEEFLGMLCASFGIGLVHLHNISGSREPLQDAMPRLRIPYGYTVHDLAFACPTITLQRADGGHCGGVTDLAACRVCLAGQRDFASEDIARWRERHGALLAAASFVIAPSRWAADMLRRYFPGVDAKVVPHGLPPRRPRRPGALQVVMLPDDGVPTVAILGAVGPDKGARRVERLAALAAEQQARVRFVVVGYLDRRQAAWQSEDGRLTVHGPYQAGDLPALLDYYRASLVLFPSLGPESFAFTLSEAWAAGRAVLVPPIGALAERVGDHGAGFVMSDEQWRDERAMLDCILELVSPDHAVAIENAGARAATMPIPALDDMASATTAIYERAALQLTVIHAAVDRRRICEAFGYRPWAPPRETDVDVTPSPVPEAAPDSAMRRPLRTRMGHWLVRFVPARAADALRAKLR